MSYNNNYHQTKWAEKQQKNEDVLDSSSRQKRRQRKALCKSIGKIPAYQSWWLSLSEEQQEDVLDHYYGGDIKRFVRYMSEIFTVDPATLRKNKISVFMK
jgi:hypothetical protein